MEASLKIHEHTAPNFIRKVFKSKLRNPREWEWDGRSGSVIKCLIIFWHELRKMWKFVFKDKKVNKGIIKSQFNLCKLCLQNYAKSLTFRSLIYFFILQVEIQRKFQSSRKSFKFLENLNRLQSLQTIWSQFFSYLIFLVAGSQYGYAVAWALLKRHHKHSRSSIGFKRWAYFPFCFNQLKLTMINSLKSFALHQQTENSKTRSFFQKMEISLSSVYKQLRITFPFWSDY